MGSVSWLLAIDQWFSSGLYIGHQILHWKERIVCYLDGTLNFSYTWI